MLENSRDVLNYALALSALVTTFLVAWLLWYIIGIFREVKRLTHDITEAVRKFNRVLDEARDRIAGLSTVVPFVIKAVERVVESIRRARAATGTDEAAGNRKQKKSRSTE